MWKNPCELILSRFVFGKWSVLDFEMIWDVSACFYIMRYGKLLLNRLTHGRDFLVVTNYEEFWSRGSHNIRITNEMSALMSMKISNLDFVAC